MRSTTTNARSLGGPSARDCVQLGGSNDPRNTPTAHSAQPPAGEAPFARHALDLARRGWPVFPCHNKVPLTRRGLHEASCDPAIIAEWARRGPGIDTRGEGGYIIVPPSWGVHQYAWIRHPDRAPLAAVPQWLLDALLRGPKARPGAGAEHWRRVAAEPVPEGARNHTLARLAGHLLRRYVDPQVTLDLLRAWNVMWCAPPLPDAEVAQTVASIHRRELERRGTRP
jgi:hypothetical protein